MRILENSCMLLPKALKMRAIKDTMALIADSIGGTKRAPAQIFWHLRHLNPALLNRQGMSTHPKMESGSELCHWKGQLIIGRECCARYSQYWLFRVKSSIIGLCVLCVDPVRPCKPLLLGLVPHKRPQDRWHIAKAWPTSYAALASTWGWLAHGDAAGLPAWSHIVRHYL